jgi:hypothetical protein
MIFAELSEDQERRFHSSRDIGYDPHDTTLGAIDRENGACAKRRHKPGRSAAHSRERYLGNDCFPRNALRSLRSIVVSASSVKVVPMAYAPD